MVLYCGGYLADIEVFLIEMLAAIGTKWYIM